MPETKEKTVNISVRVLPSVRDKLVQIAKKEDRTVSWIVKQMIHDALNARKRS